MISSTLFAKNLSLIRTKVKNAAHWSGRKTDDIKIIAVTKELPPETWRYAQENNLFKLGESRVQEAEHKLKEFKHTRKQLELHLIGHLQSNKIRKAIKYFDIIQTVDTIKLLEQINKISNEENKHQKIFLQVNTGQDPNKYGFTEKEVFTAAERIKKLPHISLGGIMTIPPQNLKEKKLCKIYEKTRKIRDNIQQTIERECKYLSMGMSNDYIWAIQEGATHIRIGTALFGKRNQQC
jgi:hypothetical protein